MQSALIAPPGRFDPLNLASGEPAECLLGSAVPINLGQGRKIMEKYPK